MAVRTWRRRLRVVFVEGDAGSGEDVLREHFIVEFLVENCLCDLQRLP